MTFNEFVVYALSAVVVVCFVGAMGCISHAMYMLLRGK